MKVLKNGFGQKGVGKSDKERNEGNATGVSPLSQGAFDLSVAEEIPGKSGFAKVSEVFGAGPGKGYESGSNPSRGIHKSPPGAIGKGEKEEGQNKAQKKDSKGNGWVKHDQCVKPPAVEVAEKETEDQSTP
jgi:hypothetical protein